VDNLLHYRIRPALDRDQADANDPAFCEGCGQELGSTHEPGCDFELLDTSEWTVSQLVDEEADRAA
jgi:hypothetical protein